MDSLAVLKALGDETRFGMYRELLASPAPLSTHELAARLDLHANTVRLHLERLRDAGLVEVEAVHSGNVGRPHHRYSVVPNAPTFGTEPPTTGALVEMLSCLAEQAGVSARDAVEAGSRWMAELQGSDMSGDDLSVLVGEMERWGFEPVVEERGIDQDATEVSVVFRSCAFRDHAEAHPEVVCNLHRGICEGLVAGAGGRITSFCTLYDGPSCRATLARAADASA